MGLIDGKNEDVHPSYGTVGFSKRFGGKMNLFGSSIRTHMSTITLTIHEAKRYHDLSEDRIYGGNKIIQVELSAAQFSELLTTMNVGSGVPCTIRHRKDVGRIEDPPDEEIEIDRVQQGFKEKLTEIRERIKEASMGMQEILAKRSLNKQDKHKIQWIVDKVLQDVTANWPFVVDQFGEATERVVTAAKSEIDSFVTTMVQVTGLKQLKKMAAELETEPKQLTDSDKEA